MKIIAIKEPVLLDDQFYIILYNGIEIISFILDENRRHFETVQFRSNIKSNRFFYVKNYINTQLKRKFNPLSGTETIEVKIFKY